MNVAHKNYRPDIDGLRAIAILAVLFYHFFQNSMPGGFVGVDIFFVISGYLITKNILNEIHQQNSLFREFYKRRIIRIFPALTATLLFCFFVGEFILPVNDNKELQKHIIAGVLFLSNYLLPWESGYFEIAMTKKPLMHLWSLAIEEQFYIIWPLMVVCIFKFRHKIKIIYLLALLSLCYNIYLLNESVVFGYFSAFARFWELLAGAILAHREIDKATNPEKYSQRKIGNYIKKITGLTIKTINDSKSVYGIVLIALSCYFRISLDVNLYAPFAVIGAYLLISAGNGAVVNRFLLSAKPMVFIGLISYPLYLWHWPLLSIYRIEFGEYISLPGNVALIILSFLLSYFTYKFIEIPIRFGVKISKECRVGALLWVIVIICMAAAYSYYNNGAPLSKNSKTEFQTSFENAPQFTAITSEITSTDYTARNVIFMMM